METPGITLQEIVATYWFSGINGLSGLEDGITSLEKKQNAVHASRLSAWLCG